MTVASLIGARWRPASHVTGVPAAAPSRSASSRSSFSANSSS
jgi:hypothetical protein